MRTIKHLHGLQTALPIWYQPHHMVIDLILLLHHIYHKRIPLTLKKKHNSKSRKKPIKRTRNEWQTHQADKACSALVQDSHEVEALQGSPTLHQHIVYLLVRSNLGPKNKWNTSLCHWTCISYSFSFKIWLEKLYQFYQILIQIISHVLLPAFHLRFDWRNHSTFIKNRYRSWVIGWLQCSFRSYPKKKF